MVSKKNKKIVERIVGEDSSLEAVARLWLYQRDDLFKLEILAVVLNDVPSDSPEHWLAELIERLVTTPPKEQKWVREASSIIGPTRCTPAPGSPLYGFNKFLAWNPCILRIEGLERAGGNISVNATHIAIPVPLLMQKELGLDDDTIDKLTKTTAETDRILWTLWEVFYRGMDLTRLKNCPMCHKWFVDHTKNKGKIRCGASACTSKRWTWEERKKAGHHMSGSNRKTMKRGR
jgi:hypothetical protein